MKKIKFIKEYKINESKVIPIHSIYELSKEDDNKYISKGLPTMNKSFIDGPGKEYVVEYKDEDKVSLKQDIMTNDIMNWKIELLVQCTKEQAIELRKELEYFIKDYKLD